MQVACTVIACGVSSSTGLSGPGRRLRGASLARAHLPWERSERETVFVGATTMVAIFDPSGGEGGGIPTAALSSSVCPE